MKSITSKFIIFVMTVAIFIAYFRLLGFLAGNLLPISPLGTMIGLITTFLLIPISYLSAHGVVKVIKEM